LTDIWASYIDHPTPDLRKKLIEQYAPLAKYVVDRLNFIPSGGISYDDLISQALVGLIEAIDRYDPARGVKFNTYAYYRIRGSVLDMIRELDWVPRSLRAKSHDLAQIIARMEGELGRPPTDAELADALGLTSDQFDDLMQELGSQTVLSLDETLDSDGDAHVPMGDMIVDEATISPTQFTEDSDQRRILAETIRALPEKEQQVISLYYTDGLTLKEIGAVLGITESRVCQLHSKAITRMRVIVQEQYV